MASKDSDWKMVRPRDEGVRLGWDCGKKETLPR